MISASFLRTILKASPLAFAAAAAPLVVLAAQPAVETPKPPPNPSMTCKFASGPLAGQTKSYRSAPGAAPLAEGAPCTDGAGSIGVAVPDATTPNPTSAPTRAETGPERPPAKPNGSTPPQNPG